MIKINQFSLPREDKTFFPLLIVLIFVLTLSYSYNEILRPAYFSVIGVCQPEKFEGNGYVKAGSTNTTINESGESNTEIYVNAELTPKQRKETLKHEYCHYYQAEVRIPHFPSQECFKPIEKYFSELECYVTWKFPDKIYEKMYNVEINELKALF